MNKKGVLETPKIIFAFIILTIIFTAMVLAINEITTNYDLSYNQTEYEDAYQDINQSVTDLQGTYTDEAEQARGEGTEVDQGFTSVFRGIKTTAQTFTTGQAIVSGFARFFNFIPTWVYGLISFVIIIAIVAAIYSDLRGK